MVENHDTPQKEIDSLKKLITENGGTFKATLVTESKVLSNSQIHHIITVDTNFADAEAANSLMIPMTTPSWVIDSVEVKQKRNYRLYAPKPLPIMDRVVLCIADNISQADRDAMYTGVRALGGQYLDALSRYTTHLVAEDLSNNKSLVAASIHRPDVEIKIVLPQWVGDCIKKGHKVDEGPYLLTDPVVLQTGKPNSSVDLKSPVTEDKNGFTMALAGKNILLDSSYSFSDLLRTSVTSHISRCGGAVVSDFSSGVDILVCKHRSGKNYEYCISEGIEIASLLWIFHVAVHGFVSPSKSNLLHYPAPPLPLPQFQGLRISVTGYSGDARYYLAQIIALLGAEFTKTLDSHNDYLICAKGTGDKYNAVKKRWPGVTVVNHLWIEESYSQWKFLDPSQNRYAKIGSPVPLGSTRLNFKALTGNEPNNINQSQSSTKFNKNLTLVNSETQESQPEQFHDITDHQISNSSSHNPLIVKKNDKNVNPLEFGSLLNDEPLPAKEESSEKEDKEESPTIENVASHDQDDQKLKDATILTGISKEIPQEYQLKEIEAEVVDVYEVHLSPMGRASRSAKQKASAKLHSDMEDLNKYTSMSKSVRKMRTFMEELEQSSPVKKRSLQNEPENTKKLKSDFKKTQEPEAKKEQTHIVAIVTGSERELVLQRGDITKLSRVGISIVNDYSPKKTIDTIIAPRVLRTEKFLKSLSKAKRIVHPKFLADILTRLSMADLSWNEISKEFNIDDYALDKIVPVKQLNEDLGAAGKTSGLPRLLSHEYGLVFEGVKLNLSTNVNGGVELIKSILEAHGLVDCKEVKLSANTAKAKMLENFDGKTIVVAHKTKDKKVVAQISGLTAVDWDWCVKSIFNGQLQDYEKYSLGS